MNKADPVKTNPWEFVFLGVLVVTFVIAILGLTHLTTIRDWYILRSYHPPTQVSQLASSDGFTDYARKLFFVNEPQITNKNVFASVCPNGIDQSYVIGCYHSGDNGIYLLNVQAPELNGIIPVTAAYEMLHAGYARLPTKERDNLNRQMWSFYSANVNTPEIRQQMAAYLASEPGAQYDELYSVLATEVDYLPSALESHYRLYFTDRAAVVTMYDHYQAAFTSRQQIIASDDTELASLKKQIETNQTQLVSLLATINSQQQVLDREKTSGNLSTYNDGVPGFNQQVTSYNDLVLTTKNDISEYNSIVSQRNSLVLEEQQLIQAISASPTTTSYK